MFELVFLLSYFASFRWVQSISAEFQPVGGVVALLCICVVFFQRKLKCSRAALILFAYILILSISYFMCSLFFEGASLLDLLAYLIGPSLLVYFYERSERLSYRLYRAVFFILLVFMLIQLFVPAIVQPYLGPFFEKLISRFKFGDAWGVRGISLAYSEPAHAARYIWLLAFFLVYVAKLQKISVGSLQLGAFAFLLLCVTNRSMTLLALILLTAIVFIVAKLLLSKALKLALYLICGFVCAVFFFYVTDLWRYGRLEQIIFSLIYVYEQGFSIEHIQLFGSIRFISVYAGYAIPFYFPTGFGIGQSGHHMISVIDAVGFDVDSIGFINDQMTSEYLKAGAYFAQLSADLGYIGIAIACVFVAFVLVVLVKSRDAAMIAFGLVALFQLVLYSTSTITAPWMVLGFALGYINRMAKVER